MVMLKPGDKIRLIEMPNDPSPIEPGTEGVVCLINRFQESDQVLVEWESDRQLALVVPPDKVEVIGHEEVPEPWASLKEV